MRRALGFTLIELMVVVAILSILAALALPSLLSARMQSNETSAIATLRNLAAAQAQFQTMGKADADVDGTGEFGMFLELSGAIDVRGNAAIGPLAPPVLSGVFRRLAGPGLIHKSGYLFLLCLPNDAGEGHNIDIDPMGRLAWIDANNAEHFWCCYAWPVSYGTTGYRTYMVNQAGDILATEDSAYSGMTALIDPAAAFDTVTSSTINGNRALGGIGFDGNTWLQVN